MECFDTVEAARFIHNSGVNIKVEFSLDWNGDTLFVMRATPWRSSAAPNRMILVAAITLDEALCTIAEELEGRRWIPLNWRARPMEAGVYDGNRTTPRLCSGAPITPIGKGSNLKRNRIEHTGEGENGA